MAAHLLSLPRHLRDLIYPYLSASRGFERCWSPDDEYDVAHVQIENVANVSVLSTNSQLRDEYLSYLKKPRYDAAKLSAFTTYRLRLVNHASQRFWHKEKRNSDVRAKAELKNVQHATLFIECPTTPDDVLPRTGEWHVEVKEFLETFTAMAPNLYTLRVAFQMDCKPILNTDALLESGDFITNDESNGGRNYMFKDLSPTLPRHLAGLRLCAARKWVSPWLLSCGDGYWHWTA